MKNAFMVLLAGVITLGISACGSGETTTTPAAATTDKVPAAIVLAKAPEGEKSITDIKKDSKEGDEVVIHGYVGGRKTPFTANRATMLVVDKGLANSCTKTDDHCPTPWDYCCEDAAVLRDKMATVQVTDAEGKLLRAELKGVGGLKELSEVVIKGKIQKKDDGLIINATGIYVKG